LESRVGFAPTYAVLQTGAFVAVRQHLG